MKKIKIEAKMIGRRIIVVDAQNKSLIGLSGKVINETRNMLTVRTNDREKKIIKKQVEVNVR